MAFEVITSAEIAVDAPLKTGLFSKIKNSLDFLNGVNTTGVDAAGAPLVLNGSFESPAVATSTTPDNWTIVAGNSGAAVLVNTQQNHGAQSLKFVRSTTAGQSGGTATSSSFFNVSPSLRYQMRFMLLCSHADVSNTVVINWYAADQSPLSSDTVFSNAGSAPTSWTAYGIFVTPPATAVFGKIVLSGGTTTTTPASTASIYFDAVTMIVKPALTEQTVYTSQNTLTVPAGAFVCKIRVWGASTANTPKGGYAEKTITVKPGDSIAATRTLTGPSSSLVWTVTHTPSGTTIIVGDYFGGSGMGTASGGTINQTGASIFPTASVSLEY